MQRNDCNQRLQGSTPLPPDYKFNVGGTVQPYFTTCNGQKVYIIFDASHMVKLLRNTLQAYHRFISPTGTVSWEYITHLNQVQEAAGLRLANNLSNKHVFFEQQKMKVSLAVQTFSSSVANALRTMKQIGYPGFEDCEATADFIQVLLHITFTNEMYIFN